jgi:thiamine monophosphate kinase
MHDGAASPHEGEDHELLFTAAADAAMPAMIEGTVLTKIGTVSAASAMCGCVMIGADGRDVDAAELGWDHGA